MHRFTQYFTVVIVSVVTTGLISCSDGMGPEDTNKMSQPDPVMLTERVPDNLQNNDTQTYGAIVSMQGILDLGQSQYSSIYQNEQSGNEQFQIGNLTIVYNAEAETRNGVPGTTWSITYDGSFSNSDTTISFNNITVFSGWTANDGSAGSFTFDFGQFAVVHGESSQDYMGYQLDWSTDDAGTLTVESELQGEDVLVEAVLVLHEDGSGTYVRTVTDSEGNVSEFNAEWNATGEQV